MRVFYLIALVCLAVSITSAYDRKYALDLTLPNAKASLGSFNFGSTSTTTVGFQLKTVNTGLLKFSYPATLIHLFDTYGGDGVKDFKVQIANKNTLAFKIGITTFSITSSGPSISVPSSEYQNIVINLENAASSCTITVYKDNVLWGTYIHGQPIPSGVRNFGFLGAEANANGYSKFFTGYLDNVIIKSVLSDSDFRIIYNQENFDVTELVGITFFAHFDDTFGVGDEAVALTSVSGDDQNWITISLQNGAQFSPRTNDKWVKCYASGDPHGISYSDTYNTHQHPGSSPYKLPYFEDVFGEMVWWDCTEHFEVRTYTRYTYTWSNTVFRQVGIRFLNYVFLFSLNEANVAGHSCCPEKSVKLLNAFTNQPMSLGFYYREVNDFSGWKSLDSYKNKGLVPFEVDGEFTGASFKYYVGGSNDHIIQFFAANYGSVKIDAYDNPMRHMKVETQVNSDLCPIEERTGSCEYQYNVDASVQFTDWRPTVLADPVVPVVFDPCEDVDPAIYDKIKENCEKFVCDGELGDCMYDACVIKDPEYIFHQGLEPCCLTSQFDQQVETVDCPVGCPNFCNFRGECNNGVCDCNGTGYTGLDCGQKETYDCSALTYQLGGEDQKFVTRAILLEDSDDLNVVFKSKSADESIVIYPAYKIDAVTGAETHYMFLVNGEIDSPTGGSYDLCITSSNGEFPITEAVNSDSFQTSSITGQRWSGSEYCVTFEWEAFSSNGLILDLGDTESNPTDLTFTLTNKVFVDQVLVGTMRAGGFALTKVPRSGADTHDFSIAVKQCDATSCATKDGDCETCASDPACGYCVEKDQCMPGGPTGPEYASCNNWRYSFEAEISRVMTHTWRGNSGVDPESEVFLSEVSADGVDVDIYVKSRTANFNYDVMLMFQHGENFAARQSSISDNVLLLLEQFSSRNVQFGIGYYHQENSEILQTLTTPEASNIYKFRHAMGTHLPSNDDVNEGGHLSAILKTCIINQNDQCVWRDNALRISMIFVFSQTDGLTEDADLLKQAKNEVVNSNILPVFVIAIDNDEEADRVADYYRSNIRDNIHGFPALVFRMTSSGSSLYEVIDRALTLGGSYPALTIDFDSVHHVDQDVLEQQADILSVSGILDPLTKVWFRLPMQGNVEDHTVKTTVNVHGFGTTTIHDVDDGRPVMSYAPAPANGKENEECIVINLIGSSFNNLNKVFYTIKELPLKGTIWNFDANSETRRGTQINEGEVVENSEGIICYKPIDYLYSFPADDDFDVLTVYAHDGCSKSDDVTVEVYVTSVPEPTVGQNLEFTIDEGEDLSAYNPHLQPFEEDGDPLDENNDEKFVFYFTSVTVESEHKAQLFGSVDFSGILFLDGVNVNELTAANPSKQYTKLDEDNNPTIVPITYVVPDENFYGVITANYNIEDAAGHVSTYHILITVVSVNDAPTSVTLRPYYSKEDEVLTATFGANDIDSVDPGVEVCFTIDSTQNPSEDVFTHDSNVLSVGVEYCLQGDFGYIVNINLDSMDNAHSYCEESGSELLTLEARHLEDLDSFCTPYAVISFVVDDQEGEANSEILDIDPLNLYVVPINDAPNKPENIYIDIYEDETVWIEVLGTDIDSGDELLQVNIQSINVNTLNSFYFTDAQSNEISGAYSDLPEAMKRGQITRSFYAAPNSDAHGLDKEDGFVLGNVFFEIEDQALKSQTSSVTIRVKPVNDEPVPLTNDLRLKEHQPDSPQGLSQEQGVIVIATTDVDNVETDMTYTITSIPEQASEEEGVVLYRIVNYTDENNYEFGDAITETDIGSEIERTCGGKACVGARGKGYWYGVGSFTYDTTDVDHFFNLQEPDYIQNIINKQVTITVLPTNNAPVAQSISPIVYEDTASEIQLLGSDIRWGEDDTVKAVIEGISGHVVYTDHTGTSQYGEAGKLCEYNEDLLLDVNAECTEIGPSSEITGDLVVIYVPPEHKNSHSSRDHLLITPKFKYYLLETTSHAEPAPLKSTTETVSIDIMKVNDAPVAAGNPWTTVNYGDVYGIVDGEWPEWENTCWDTCHFLEDFGTQGQQSVGSYPISFGGKDVELSDLSITLVSVDCPPNTILEGDDRINFAADNFNSFPYTIATPVSGSKILTAALSFTPAKDDWNIDNTGNAEGGHPGDHYCSIVYKVEDQEGLTSGTKEILITVEQVNDLPLYLRRDGDDPVDGEITDTSIFMSDSIRALEDYDAFLYVNAEDVENNLFKVVPLSCGSSGTFWAPSVDQHNYIDEDGNLDFSSGVDVLFGDEIDCSQLNANTPQIFPTSSVEVSNKGWFIRFRGDSNEYGNNYNKIQLAFVDEFENDDPNSPPRGTYATLAGISRVIHILPVNDAPSISINDTVVVEEGPLPVITPELVTVDPVVDYGTFENSLRPREVFSFTDWSFADADALFNSVPAQVAEYSVVISIIDQEFVETDATKHEDIVFGFSGSNSVTFDEETQTLTITGTSAVVQSFLTQVSLAPSMEGVYTFEITVNDHGFDGNCPPGMDSEENGNCPRTATLVGKIVCVSANTAIGNSIAAAGFGFAALSLLAALGAVRKFQDRSEGFDDNWTKAFDSDDEDAMVLDNPLFEADTIEGVSAIYQAPAEQN
eukprot:TRINITY_DN1218_c1_g1_i1.p1 TRINITY_DN1218_c1_g1~~TRINITY_DN1218_c1_g1_i1.p1  ORF type:complete len:2606 (-),score=681.68 TRINITY_DN1218_c1_g1_i1:77-7840(-)